MRNLIMLFLLLGFLSISSCSSSDEDQNTTGRTYEDIEADFLALELNAGINDVTLNNANGDPWTFRIIMPADASETNKRPLVITLHGASGWNPNAHKSTACYAEPGFEALDAIIISPNGLNMQWWEPYNQDMILSLVKLASENLPVDASKIVVNGYSDGGNASWYYAEVWDQYFSAGIPMASSYNTYNTNGQPRKIDTPLYVIHGEDDELFPLEQTREWVEATREAGTDITFEIAPGLEHDEPCEYVPYLEHASEWLMNEVWN
ncbi:dienelactone hydrolase family protein [Zunongwangia sp. H14]|uniref:carboxylesterase family protein n=1 Tax=Zunongwangia sp. H14 TaxID=3240792 RepID=UPI003562F07F